MKSLTVVAVMILLNTLTVWISSVAISAFKGGDSPKGTMLGFIAVGLQILAMQMADVR